MDFGAAMFPGMVLELGEASVNGLIAEAGNVVHKAALGVEQPKAILLAHCGGRAIALGDRIREIPAELEHTVGHLPFDRLPRVRRAGLLGARASRPTPT